MKALHALTAAVMTAALLAVPVSAAMEFTPSVEEKDAAIVSMGTDANGKQVAAYVTDENGNTVAVGAEYLSITVSGDKKADKEILDLLAQAKKELTTTDIETLLPDFAKLWEKASEGAPVENAVVTHLFDVTMSDEVEIGKNVTFTIQNPGIALDAPVLILHRTAEGKWESVPFTRDANGNFVITSTSLSPFAIVVDSAAAPAVDPNAPTSPGTSAVVVSSASVAVAAIVSVLGVGCAVKTKRSR